VHCLKVQKKDVASYDQNEFSWGVASSVIIKREYTGSNSG
jgi:hypothetical protein